MGNFPRSGLVAALLLFACGSPTKARTVPTGAAAVPDGYGGVGSILSDTKALSRIDASASWVIVARSASSLENELRLRDLLAAWSVLPPGVADRLDSKGLAELGLDTNRPVGAAALHLESSTHAVLAFVSDRAKLIAGLSKNRQTSKAGSATIISGEQVEDIAAVIHGDIAYFVSSRAKSQRDRAAMGIATLEASKSVARAPGFKALATHLRFGRDVAAWARLSHIFQAPSSAVLDDLARIRKQTETVLADTKDERLAARLRSRIRVIDQMSRTRKNQAAIHANTLGAVEAVAVGINADGSTLKIKLAARTKTNTLVTDLVTQRAAPLQLLGAVTAPPLFFFATHAQPQAVMLAAQMWLGIRGTPLKGLKDVYAKLTQGDFDRDVVPLLSGEVGFAATGRSADLSKAGVHLLLGVKSRADAERVLAKLADSPLVKMMSTKTKAGVRIKVPMPDGRSVHVGVVADAIVATTEPDAFERVGKPGVGFARTLPGSALGPLLGTRTSAALLVSPILRAFASQKERGQRSLIGAPPPASKAPISQDHRDAQKRVTELRTKLATERARAAANRRSARVALAAKMGLLGLVMTRDEHGLVGHGGLFFAAPVKAAVGELAAERARAAQAERIAAATVAAHERELIDAMKQVRKVRLRDIADYELRKQTKPVPKKP